MALGLRSLRLVDTDDEMKERLAFAIRVALLQKRWKPPDLARALGRDPSTVTRWADGTSVPNLLMIEPLAKALGVEPKYLYHPEEIPTDYPLSLVRQATPAAVEEGARRARSRRGESGQ